MLAGRFARVVSWDVAGLAAVQSVAGAPLVHAARGFSRFGEHAAGWVGIVALGAVLDAQRRPAWLRAGVAVLAAHTAASVVKRGVRRRRPQHPSVTVHVRTPSALSFPSSHASSSTAAAVVLGRLLGVPLVPVIVPSMGVSRLVLGVHYPTDVLAGAALGAAVAAALRAYERGVAR